MLTLHFTMGNGTLPYPFVDEDNAEEDPDNAPIHILMQRFWKARDHVMADSGGA